MSKKLCVNIGQCSDEGRKSVNQDFHGAVIPEEPLLSSKGIAMAIADGISSSDVSQIASETSVKSFLEDYYSTVESWSIKTSVQRVLQAINSWLYAQTCSGSFRYELDRGYICTFTALIFKSNTVHVFHIGDARAYYLSGDHLEQLTEDHRLWISREKSYLRRALGMRSRLEIDYLTYSVEVNDTLLLMTDGVYEFVDDGFVCETLDKHEEDLDLAARSIVNEAINRGSTDNLTLQIARVEQVPLYTIGELVEQAETLPFPPDLRPRMEFEGYEIVRELHNSSRSHIYLALDLDTGRQVALKVPSVDLRDNSEYRERFLMEEWVAHRIENAHILKACDRTRKRQYLYIVTEYIEGQTLNQWIADNPKPELKTVRNLVEQIARGLYSLHHKEILHQDLRPNNIMIDKAGTVKLIDFGSVRIAGITEIGSTAENQDILGTTQYTAPEYFLGEAGTPRSDLFSLGVITYQMLSGNLPFGTQVAKATSRAAQRKLFYQSLIDSERDIPAWVDDAIRKAVHPDPYRRYDEVSEFVQDLRQPNPAFLNRDRPPLLERSPATFWKGLSILLVIAVILLLITHPVAHG